MDIFGVLLAATTVGLLLRNFAKRKNYKAEHRVTAESAYRALSVEAPDPRFSFDANSAQMMSDKEAVEEIRGNPIAYLRTIIARNASGEYFWFHFRTDSPPLFKHLDQGRAKVLLKERYLAPPLL